MGGIDGTIGVCGLMAIVHVLSLNTRVKPVKHVENHAGDEEGGASKASEGKGGSSETTRGASQGRILKIGWWLEKKGEYRQDEAQAW